MERGAPGPPLSRGRRRLVAFVLVGASGLSLAALLLSSDGPRFLSPLPTSTPSPTSWPIPSMESPEYGMQAFMWWREEVAIRDLGLIRDAGFGWVKQRVAWRDVEGAGKGLFEWAWTDRIVRRAEEAGLDILFRLDAEPAWAVPAEGVRSDNGPPDDPQDFGDFCHALAERYRGRVRAYQVWNEPNLAREWGGFEPNPEEYVQLLRVCYVGIKTADPTALVVSAGLAPTGTGPPGAMPDIEFLTQMYEAGAAPYFDALGVNAPGYGAPPELSPEDAAAIPEYGGQRFFCFRHVEDARQVMVRYGDTDKQVVVLEMGWTSDPRNTIYSWFAVTEEVKADYLVRAFAYAREHWSPWIGLMTVISVADHDWTEEDEQYWWAITEPGWPETTVRPAYEALQAMGK
jgi:hypothetical protein